MQPVRSFLNSIKEANESCFLPIIRRHFSCSNVSQSRSFQRTMSGSRDQVVIEAKDGKHSATIIFMHGLGDTGHGWADTLRQIKPDYVKLICPTAPVAPVSLNMGMPMPSWFDLFSLETDGLEDGEGVKKSSQTIVSLIEKEKTSHNIPADRILLGGFSQGGALALHTGVRYPEKLAGIIAFSCWLPLHKEYPGAFNQNCKDLAVLQCHGEADPLVMYDWGVRTSNLLKSFLTNHEFKSYPNMGHSSCNEELKDAQIFISKVLPEK